MDISVSGVAPGTYAFCACALSFLKALKQANADGWQAGQDLPAVLQAALSSLSTAVADWSAMSAELKTDVPGVIKAVLMSGLEAYGLLK